MQPSTDSYRRSLLEIHVAVVFFGLAGLFGKLVAYPATIIVLGRVFFASIFLALALRYFGQSVRLARRADYGYLIFLGVLLAVHWIAFFQSIKVSTVAIGLLTFSTFPVFVTFLEPCCFKERLKTADVIVALVTFGGVALVVPKFEIADNMTRGVMWGVLGGFTFAVLSILNRKYVRSYSSLVIAFYQDLVAAIVLLPFLVLTPVDFQVKDFLLLLFLGIVCTGLSHSLFIQGLKNVKAQTASIIACLEPIYGILLAVFVVAEIPTWRVILGGMIILIATSYATMRPKTGAEHGIDAGA